MSSCIIRGKELKLNTFNLKASTTKGEKSSGKNERISINRYYAVKRDRFYVRNTGSCKLPCYIDNLIFFPLHSSMQHQVHNFLCNSDVNTI